MNNVPIIARFVLTILFMTLLVGVSIVPGRAQPGDSVFVFIVAKTPTAIQKLLHLSMYALLTLMWVWTLEAIQSRPTRLLIAALIAVIFGASMEWYQTRVPGRFGTIVDVALNAAGAVLGLIAAIVLL
jgi:hypothetical protein